MKYVLFFHFYYYKKITSPRIFRDFCMPNYRGMFKNPILFGISSRNTYSYTECLKCVIKTHTNKYSHNNYLWFRLISINNDYLHTVFLHLHESAYLMKIQLSPVIHVILFNKFSKIELLVNNILCDI